MPDFERIRLMGDDAVRIAEMLISDDGWHVCGELSAGDEALLEACGFGVLDTSLSSTPVEREGVRDGRDLSDTDGNTVAGHI